MEIIMQAVPKRTATKNSKGSKLFIRSVAAHMTHANRHVHPFVCDFTKKNKSIFFNILVPAVVLAGCWYLIIIAISLL